MEGEVKMSADVKNKILTRNEVEENLTWRLEDIFPTEDEWEKDFSEVAELAKKASSYQGTIENGPEALLNVLTYRDELTMRLRKLYTYAHMRSDQDTANSKYQAMDSRIKSLFVKVSTELSFLVPEILSLDETTLKSYLQENKGLQVYRQMLEEINKERPHVLPKEQEALLAQFAEIAGASADTFGKLNNADLEFPFIKDEEGNEVQITHGRYSRFLESEDRRVREDAFKAMYETYGKFRNTFASTLSGNIKGDNVNAQIRNYASAREAALSANHIPESVYDNLVGTINKNVHLLHRYVSLRKKVLGLEELHMWIYIRHLLKSLKWSIRMKRPVRRC